MFYKKLKEQLRLYKEDNKNKACEITGYLKENEKLKYKLHNIMMQIEKFDHINDNAFSLINKIYKEARYE